MVKPHHLLPDQLRKIEQVPRISFPLLLFLIQFEITDGNISETVKCAELPPGEATRNSRKKRVT